MPYKCEGWACRFCDTIFPLELGAEFHENICGLNYGRIEPKEYTITREQREEIRKKEKPKPI